MFILAGKELSEGPKSNLLLKAGLTKSQNQACSQPGFENHKESTESGTTQSFRKRVPKLDCPQNEKWFFFLSSQNQSVSTRSLDRGV